MLHTALAMATPVVEHQGMLDRVALLPTTKCSSVEPGWGHALKAALMPIFRCVPEEEALFKRKRDGVC